MQYISSAVNPLVKRAVSIRQSRQARDEFQSVLIFGADCISEYMSSLKREPKQQRVETVFGTTPEAIESLLESTKAVQSLRSATLRVVNDRVMKKITGLQSIASTDIAIIGKPPYVPILNDLSAETTQCQRTLVLDAVQDAGKMQA